MKKIIHTENSKRVAARALLMHSLDVSRIKSICALRTRDDTEREITSYYRELVRDKHFD